VSSIVEALKGIKRVGRSRTAQYGLVEITEFDYKEVESDVASDGYVTVYADSRLIFWTIMACQLSNQLLSNWD
jgi:hypothetical protein